MKHKNTQTKKDREEKNEDLHETPSDIDEQAMQTTWKAKNNAQINDAS